MLWLLIGYMFLYIYRPFEIWPTLGEFRIELLYMIGASGFWLAAPDKRFSFNALTIAVAIMAAAILASSFLSPWSDECLTVVEPWFKFLVFFAMLITAVNDERSLRYLVVAFLAVTALYMLHSAYEFHCGRHVSRMGISRMVGIDGTNGDPNAFAMTVVLSMVFVPACWRSFPSWAFRACLLGYLVLGVYCISMTGSRAAFVALLIFVLFAIWKSPWRARLFALAIPTAPLLFLALPGELQNRFETIVNPEAGPKNAQISAEGRIEGFLTGMRLWQENPLFGVGLGAWKQATGKKLHAHNVYGQVAGETGTAGVLALGFLVIAYIVNIRAIRRSGVPPPDGTPDFVQQIASAIALGLFLLLFGGLFGHNLMRTHWVLFAAFLIIARQCAEQRWAEQSMAESWQAESPDTSALVPATL
jgi:O-antigen ligase